jgi:hypothetical protein
MVFLADKVWLVILDLMVCLDKWETKVIAVKIVVTVRQVFLVWRVISVNLEEEVSQVFKEIEVCPEKEVTKELAVSMDFMVTLACKVQFLMRALNGSDKQ